MLPVLYSDKICSNGPHSLLLQGSPDALEPSHTVFAVSEFQNSQSLLETANMPVASASDRQTQDVYKPGQ